MAQWGSKFHCCGLGWLTLVSVPFSIDVSAEEIMEIEMPPIEVIATSPLLGIGIDPDKMPNKTVILRSKDMNASEGAPSLTHSLNAQVGSVNLNATLGNPYQPDFSFRGFVASPVVGVPQGFAVYQNGVRINEAFGDTVNWDLVPDFAIDSMNLTSTNPVFGFNALGGAAALEMKNGFTFKGLEGTLSGGSFGRISGTAQYGQSWNNWAFYLGASPSYDSGWRINMPSRLDKIYTDGGFDNGHTKLHLSFTFANNSLNGTGPTPEALLAQNWGAGVDYPGVSNNQVAMVALRGSKELGATTSVQGNIYYRNFNQNFENGTPLAAQPCATNSSNLCTADNTGAFTVPVLDQNNSAVPVSSMTYPQFPAYIAISNTQTRTFGATLQSTTTAPIGDHGNQFVAGLSVDRGLTSFSANSQFGSFDSMRTVVPTDLFVTSSGTLNNILLQASNTYGGVYFTDTFDMTSALSLTASGRYNLGLIQLSDQLGGSLTGFHRYERLNPSIGATYKIAPYMTAFADYAESNRIPTAAELSCADPSQPCSLASFFIADPDLNQVVAQTIEVGLRGSFAPVTDAKLQWNVSAFHTNSSNDIIEVATSKVGRGYFQNAGGTTRQGVEVGAKFQAMRYKISADYSLVNATFQSNLTLNSPFNPAADSSGHIQVQPGDTLPGIPMHRFKFGADYAIFPSWNVGLTWILASSQYLQGDESNQNPPVGGYGVVNFHTEVMIKDWLQAFGSVENLFNRHYATHGTFINDSGVPPGNIGLTRTVSPAQPFGAFVGLRAKI